MPATATTRSDEASALLALRAIVERLEVRNVDLDRRYHEGSVMSVAERADYRCIEDRLTCYRNALWYLEREREVNV